MSRLYVILPIAVILLTSCGNPSTVNQNNNPQVAGVKNTSQSEYKRSTTPESVGANLITESDSFPEEYRSVAVSIAQELVRDSENPSEFYARVEAGSGVLIFHLWHEDAFKEGNQEMLGNPGGKCRDFHYNVKQQRVTKKEFWQ